MKNLFNEAYEYAEWLPSRQFLDFDEDTIDKLIETVKTLKDYSDYLSWSSVQGNLNLARKWANEPGHERLEMAAYQLRDMEIVEKIGKKNLIWAICNAKSFVRSELIAICDEADYCNSARRAILSNKYFINDSE